MEKHKHNLMWLALPATGLLIVLSVIGAFCGARNAKLLFNSTPLIFFWFGLAVLLLAGIAKFFRTLGQPGLLMILMGCLLVLAGSMWGSETGHRLRNHFWEAKKIPNGYMLIFEGETKKHVTDEYLRRPPGELPFSIRLKDFRVEYYPADDGLQLSYIPEEPRKIRDYLSDIVVIEEGKEILSKTIEVNHPLHYGGYHFYQHSYDSKSQEYSILSVVSDSGLYAVYTGYWILCIGVIWQLWLRHITGYIKVKIEKIRRRDNGGQIHV